MATKDFDEAQEEAKKKTSIVLSEIVRKYLNQGMLLCAEESCNSTQLRILDEKEQMVYVIKYSTVRTDKGKKYYLETYRIEEELSYKNVFDGGWELVYQELCATAKLE